MILWAPTNISSFVWYNGIWTWYKALCSIYKGIFEPNTKPYVLKSQCEQVFYSKVPGKEGRWYVVRYDPRGRLVKYNHVEDEDNQEEQNKYDDAP